MMLAGLPVPERAVEDLAELVRGVDADDLADRLERATTDRVALLALTDERSIILAALEDPPEDLAGLRAVLLNEHEWLQREGLD